MDYRTFKLLARIGHWIPAPSPFATSDKWTWTAKRLWKILRCPSMQSVWLRDRGLYIKTVECAKYCEGRACG